MTPFAAGAAASALFTVDGDTFTFTDADVCKTDPDSFLVQLKDGDDELLFSKSVGKLIVKVQVDDVRWSGPATHVEPEFSGDKITWSDVMAGVGREVATAKEASIEVNC